MAQAPAHPSESSGPLARRVAALVAAITASRRRSALVLVVALILGVLGFAYGATVRVDTDLRALLPKDAPSVEALDLLEARKGSSERFLVAIEAPTAADADAMVTGLAAEIEGWPETEELAVTRDYTPLRDHALYFLELAQLEELRDELEKERKQAVARAMGPGLGGTDGEVDVAVVSVGENWDDFDSGGDDLDWGTGGDDGGGDGETGETGEIAEPEAPGKKPFDLDNFLDEQRKSLVDQSGLSAQEIALIWPEENAKGEIEWAERVGKDYANDDGTVRTIQASLSRPATDVVFAQDVVGRVAARAEALIGAGIDPRTRAEVVAAYNVSGDVDTIVRDATRATWISVSLVLAVLVFGFRRIRAIALVIVPMAVAMGLTLAVAKLGFGELNALTVFLFAVLFGMGVDFSVHLFALRQRQGAVADWPAVIRDHFRPLASTMLTTAGALAVLALAEFKAFREFGVISAVGVVLCFVAALTLVPALDTLLGPLRNAKDLRAAAAASTTDKAPGDAPNPRRPGPLQILRVALLVALAGLAAYGAPRMEMEKDTRALKAERKRDKPQIAYGSTNDRCSKSLALVADSPEDLDLVVDRMLAERELLLPNAIDTGEARAPWVREVYSLHILMPTQQEAKAAALAQIAERTNDFLAELPDLDADAQRHRSHLEALERLAKAGILDTAALPEWTTEPFREKDGRVDRIAHVCLNIAGYHIDELVAVRARLDELVADTSVRPADSRLVFADLMVLVEHDAERLPLLALAVILVFIALDLRRVGPTLACFATLGLGLVLVLAFMGLWPLRLNFFNLVVMPGVVGLGIDASIHLWHGRNRASLGATGKAS
ncbi:MAG: MMPL family transporter, partial [Myxococcales bacterium]|nr:MMPL family transporter [Myxococcales bacterium]